MKIIGCDYHPSFQQIAMLDQSSGELSGRRLAQRKNRAVATVAIARKLAVRLYWILRRGAQDSPAVGSMQGSPSHAVVEARPIA